uniref:LOW QUALITY PROTEIN: uncharacterized protein LOC120338224 n=1 Tax=Styela clava TaxID=7725 RepID=UPI0019392F66|nr:LOW QUALITY PROTEIN: uncharacterized protein LOC120338224 [Styela clava]
MAAFGTFKSPVMSLFFPMFLLMTMPLISKALMHPRGRPSQCVKIENSACRGNYNYTTFPNILGHEDHDEASRRFDEFNPLTDTECSPHVKFFLCSLHFPMCVPQIPFGIPACRAMCEEVRRKCEPHMNIFNLNWPETIQCEKLPDHTSMQCMHPPQGLNGEEKVIADDPNTKTSPDDVIPRDDVTDDVMTLEPPSRGNRRQKQSKRRRDRKGGKTKPNKDVEKPPHHKEEVKEDLDIQTEDVMAGDDGLVQNVEEVKAGVEEEPPSKAPKWNPVKIGEVPLFPAVDSDTDYPDGGYPVYSNTDYDSDAGSQFHDVDDKSKTICKNPDKFLYVEKIDKCLPICDTTIDVMFSSTDKRFAYYWMLACSILCIVSSALTVGTFMVDSKRFRYPERPIIFLSLCYLLYSSAYLVRLGRGPEGSVSCVTQDNSDVTHIVMGDLESTGCTAVFFLLYYFGMAAAVWWVILSVTWFLAAGLKWGHEAIEAHGFYFHLVAWLVPAAQTIVVLVMGKVDGDELTGLCYVGNLERDSLLYFVIVPLAVYLAVGALALGSGFLSLFKIRRVILRKSGEKDAGKLEKLMLKIGIFTVLYIVPTACVVAVNVYQYKNTPLWMERAESRPCYPTEIEKGTFTPYRRTSRNAPEIPPSYSHYGDSAQYYPYREIVYGPRRPHYTDYVATGYDGAQYIHPGASFTGYGRYPDTQPRFEYGTGSFHSDSVSSPQGDESGGSYDSSLYNGRRLVVVPQHLIPEYPPGRYYKHPKPPMTYDPKMAHVLKTYAEGHDQRNNGLQPDKEVGFENEMDSDCHLVDSIPSFPIFAIKIFMSLLAGITSGIWVWSGKTYTSWKLFCRSSWCGKSTKEKENVSITPHATSIGNLNAPPSVTSQLLPKVRERPAPDGEVPSPDGNRYSYPVLSDRYQGYQPVTQEDDHTNKRDITHYTSSVDRRGQKTGLTLGDIAREYSDNLESEYREMDFYRSCELAHPRNGTYIVPPCHNGDATKNNKSWFKNNSKKARNHTTRDSINTNKSNRAIPNLYEEPTSNRDRAIHCNRQTNRNNGTEFELPHGQKYGKNNINRVRKYSENDVNKLGLVSQSGFSPVSTSTRKKAESVHVGTKVLNY